MKDTLVPFYYYKYAVPKLKTNLLTYQSFRTLNAHSMIYYGHNYVLLPLYCQLLLQLNALSSSGWVTTTNKHYLQHLPLSFLPMCTNILGRPPLQYCPFRDITVVHPCPLSVMWFSYWPFPPGRCYVRSLIYFIIIHTWCGPPQCITMMVNFGVKQ